MKGQACNKEKGRSKVRAKHKNRANTKEGRKVL